MRPAGSRGGRGSVMAVHMKRAGVGDPIAFEFFGAQGEAVVALPENRALTRVINEDKRLLAGAAGSGYQVRFDAAAEKFFAMECGCAVIADFADIAGAESPLLAGDDRAGDLAARENISGAKLDLGAAGREVVKREKRVGGVEADADKVDFRQMGQSGSDANGATLNEVRAFAKFESGTSGSGSCATERRRR